MSYQKKAYNPIRLFLYLSILLIGAFVFNDVSASGGFAQYQTGNYTSSTYLNSSKLIGIQDSQACTILLKNHIPNNCITYDKIAFLDNTNSLFSGIWVEKPYLHRAAPRVSNHYNFNLNPYVVMVDPNPDFEIRAKMIIIQSQNFTWINPDENSSNGIRIEHHNRFVSNCDYALVSPNVALINDTVHYLENGCTITHYNDAVKIVTKPKPFDFNNPYSTLLMESYLKTILHGKGSSVTNHTGGGFGLANCINHKCDIKDPYKKPRW